MTALRCKSCGEHCRGDHKVLMDGECEACLIGERSHMYGGCPLPLQLEATDEPGRRKEALKWMGDILDSPEHAPSCRVCKAILLPPMTMSIAWDAEGWLICGGGKHDDATEHPRIPGGCDDCDAYQVMDRDGMIVRISVHHDDTCPCLREHQNRGA